MDGDSKSYDKDKWGERIIKQAEYIIERARELAEPVAVFDFGRRIKVMRRSHDRIDVMLNDPDTGHLCVGVYDHLCPKEWICSDLAAR